MFTEQLKAEYAEKEGVLRERNVELIEGLVKSALRDKTVPLEGVAQLESLGLLRRSSNWRQSVPFPREEVIFHYSFDEDGKTFIGFLGFDADRRLVSIDERSPEENVVYLGDPPQFLKDAMRSSDK